MKHDWEYKLLGEVSEIVGGSTPKTSIDSYWGGEYPWVTPAELNGAKYIDKTERTITDEALAHTNLQLLPVGTVLLSSRAPIGKLAITKIPMYCNQGFKNIIPGDSLYNEFAYWYLTYKKDYIISLGRGATFKEISKSITEKIPIPIPSLEEQKQICSLLDKMNRVIEVKKEQLKELDNLAQAIFYDMFGDPITNTKGWVLSTIDNISTDKLSYGSGASAVEYDGQTRYVRITDINDLGDLNEDIKSPSEIDEKYLLREGDILFARSGATVGKTYCHSEKNGRCIYAGYLIKMRPDKSMVMPKYVFYYTKSEYYKAFIRNAQNAVAQPNINAKQYGGLAIPVPPLPLQQAFAEKVKAIERQKELINQSIKDVQTLFDAKMDYYFGD